MTISRTTYRIAMATLIGMMLNVAALTLIVFPLGGAPDLRRSLDPIAVETFDAPVFDLASGEVLGSTRVELVRGARALSDCPSGATKRFCLWMNTNFTGDRWQIGNPAPDTCVALAAPYADNAESAVNNLSITVSAWQFYAAGSPSGDFVSFGPGNGTNTFGPPFDLGNNEISAVCRP